MLGVSTPPTTLEVELASLAHPLAPGGDGLDRCLCLRVGDVQCVYVYLIIENVIVEFKEINQILYRDHAANTACNTYSKWSSKHVCIPLTSRGS